MCNLKNIIDNQHWTKLFVGAYVARPLLKQRRAAEAFRRLDTLLHMHKKKMALTTEAVTAAKEEFRKHVDETDSFKVMKIVRQKLGIEHLVSNKELSIKMFGKDNRHQ